MAKDYTIVNDQTGEEKTISWDGAAPPTQADIAHINLQISGGPQIQQPGEALPQGPDTWGGDPSAPGGSVNLQPNVPLTGWRKNLADFARPTLEGGGALAGAVGGSMLATPVIGGVAGAGLGYATGKKLADFIAGEPSKGWTGEALDTAGNALTGATMEAGGQLAGRALSAVSAPIIDRASPYVQRAVSAARDLGIPMTPAEQTGSKPLALAESVLGKLPGSSGMMQGTQQEQQAAVQAAKQGIVDNLGGTSDTLENVGSGIKEGLAASSQIFKSKAGDLYDRVTELAPQGVDVPTPSLQNTAKGMLSELNKAPDSLKNSQAMAILNDLANGIKPTTIGPSSVLDQYGNPATAAVTKTNNYDFNGIGTIRNQLNELIAANDAAVKAGQGGTAAMSNTEAGIYKRLKGALQDDINTFADTTGGDFKDAYDTANAFYRDGKQVFNAPIIRRVMKSNPEAVISMVMRPNSATDVKLLRRAVGDEAFQTAKEKFTAQLLSDEQNGLFSVAKFANNIGKYDPATLSAIYKPEEISSLKNLAATKPVVNGAERMAGNPSGTAQNMLSYAQAGAAGGLIINGLMTGDPTKIAEGATVMLAPAGIAKLYLSPIGRRYLTGTMKVSGGAQQATAIATKLIGIAGVENLRQPTRQPQPPVDPLGIRR